MQPDAHPEFRLHGYTSILLRTMLPLALDNDFVSGPVCQLKVGQVHAAPANTRSFSSALLL